MRYELLLWYLKILKSFPGKIGCYVRKIALPARIGDQSYIWDNVQIDFPSKLSVGDRCSINRGTIIHCGGGVDIGNDVLIGPNVLIYSQNHKYRNSDELISMQGYNRRKVVVEDDVWLASNVIVLPGITIKQGTVIGAGSVVTRNTESYGIYVGNPAKLISFRK